MSARDGSLREVCGPGKDNHDGTSVVGVHPGLPWPHLAYGDAVYAEIAASDPYPPEVFEAGLRQGASGVLFLRLVWLPGHRGLAEEVRGDGLSLVWSHISGWSAHTARGFRELPVGPFAAPRVLADAALHLAEYGLGCDWKPPADGDLWVHAHRLDVELAGFEDRGAVTEVCLIVFCLAVGVVWAVQAVCQAVVERRPLPRVVQPPPPRMPSWAVIDYLRARGRGRGRHSKGVS